MMAPGRRFSATYFLRWGRVGSRRRTLVPTVERLESLELLTTTPLQTVMVPTTLTNYGVPGIPPVPAAPPIALFNPALGTLTAVHLTTSVTLLSNVTTHNSSQSSAATNLQAQVTGTYSFQGLSQAVTGTPSSGPVAGPNLAMGASFTFPTVTAVDTRPATLSAPADLAFYTASTATATIAPTLSATGNTTVAAVNGNLMTNAVTSAGGTITVAYDYTPTTPIVVSLARFGIHHQQTQLVLTLSGPIAPAEATNVHNYNVLAPGPDGRLGTGDDIKIPIRTATYAAAKNQVTLIPVTRLNFHDRFLLQVTYPSNNGNTITIPFGTKFSLAGFTGDHHHHLFLFHARTAAR